MLPLFVVVLCFVSFSLAQSIVPCDRCGTACSSGLTCCTACGGRYGTCAASCGITCDVLFACPPASPLPNCSGACGTPVVCPNSTYTGLNPVCGLIPKLSISASAGAANTTVYTRTATATCGDKFNCFPRCVLQGCSSCQGAPAPTAVDTLPGSATTDQCADSNLTFPQRHCTHKFSNLLCDYNGSACPTSPPAAAVTVEQKCEALVGRVDACAKRVDPSPCTGVNHPCKCRFDLGCVLLVTDPDGDLNSRYVCTDPLFARVRFMALTGLVPNMRVDIKFAPPTGLNCSNPNVTTNTDVSNGVGDATEQSVIHDDVEDAYACCVNKLIGNSSLPKCLHIDIAHQAQPLATASATDFQMVSHHLAVCPAGVTLSAQDQVLHCQCMKLAHQIVTGVSFPGPCVVSAGVALSGKRAIAADSGNVMVTSASTQSSQAPAPASSQSPSASSTTSSSMPVVPSTGDSAGLVSSLVLLLFASFVLQKCQ